MVKVSGQNIVMNVGDKIALNIAIKGWEGYTSGDKVYIAVKPNSAGSVIDNELTLTSSNGSLSATWSVSSSVTEKWEVGGYTYEFRVEYADGVNRDILQQGGTITVKPVIK